MLFVETPEFTKDIVNLITDDDYRALQSSLLLRPGAGSLIPASGGVRKIRWGGTHSGKRGGIRVLYYWDMKDDALYMLLAYSKRKQSDLIPSQLRTLAQHVRREFK